MTRIGQWGPQHRQGNEFVNLTLSWIVYRHCKQAWYVNCGLIFQQSWWFRQVLKKGSGPHTHLFKFTLHKCNQGKRGLVRTWTPYVCGWINPSESHILIWRSHVNIGVTPLKLKSTCYNVIEIVFTSLGNTKWGPNPNRRAYSLLHN